MALDAAWNRAIGTLSTGYDASATSIVLVSGDGTRFGATPPFNCVWWNATTYANPANDPNMEIVRVTAVNVDTLTVTRGQETGAGGLAASTKNAAGATYKIAHILTAKTITDITGNSIDIGAETVYVTEYGATGDGVTDDTSAVASAITAGNLVIFPPGTYRISTLTLKSNLTLLGAGPGATTIQRPSAVTGNLLKDGGSALTDITIRGFTISGIAATSGNLIDLDNGLKRFWLENCRFTSPTDDAVNICASAGTAESIFIRNIEIDSPDGHGIQIQNANNDNSGVFIDNVRIYNPGDSVASAKAGILARGSVQISNCRIENVNQTNRGIELPADDGTLGNGSHGATVTGCWISGVGTATAAYGMIVAANQVRIAASTIRAGGQLTTGIHVNGGQDCSIIGCTVEGKTTAIDLDNADWAVISGCLIAGVPTTGISIDSNTADATLRDNNIGGTTAVTDSGTNTHARNNRGWVTHNVVTGAQFNTSGSKQESIAHGLDVTPTVAQCILTIVSDGGTAPSPSRQYVEATDATNVTVESLSQDTNAYKHAVTIDARP